jgi:hypothetical protein
MMRNPLRENGKNCLNCDSSDSMNTMTFIIAGQ